MFYAIIIVTFLLLTATKNRLPVPKTNTQRILVMVCFLGIIAIIKCIRG